MKAFEKQGKHIAMTNGERNITIPRANPVDAYIMGGIIKDAGLSIDEFKRLLRDLMFPLMSTESGKHRMAQG